MKFAEKWGDSVDIAVELALQDLGLSKDQVNITILEQPSKGFFGIGSKLAKVRVEEKAAEPEVRTVKAVEPAPVKKPEPAPVPAAVKSEVDPDDDDSAPLNPENTGRRDDRRGERPDRNGRRGRNNNRRKDRRPREDRNTEDNGSFNGPDPDDFIPEDLGLLSEKPEGLQPDNDNPAKAFLDQVFREMQIDVTVNVFSGEDCVYAEVEGPDCGTVIGKRGQTLDAIQYLTSLVVNKGKSGYIRTIIDAEGYRKKREVTLEKLAVKLADKALRSGRSIRLEPMNPYERKVIHSVLQKYPGVTTKSEGREPYRRVIIEPEK